MTLDEGEGTILVAGKGQPLSLTLSFGEIPSFDERRNYSVVVGRKTDFFSARNEFPSHGLF